MPHFLTLLVLLFLTACAGHAPNVPPERYTYSFTTDRCGNITSMTDARGVVTNYTWDALNRLKTIAYPSAASLNATLSYDLASGCGSAPIGQLCSVTDASGTIKYEYNDLGQLTKATETRGALSFTTGYTYDKAGNVLTITLPSGRVVTYTRNANGQVSGVGAVVAGSPVALASSIAYLPFGPVTAMTYGNSLTLSATYDQDYNPTNRAVSTIYSYVYDTDDAGNIIQIGGTDYGYDALNRLDEEDAGSAVNYTYDTTSNRLTVDATSYTYPSTSNKLSAAGSNAYTYDAAGNITDDDINTYAWNAAGNLSTVNTTAGVYTYNYTNQRTKKVAGGNTTHYVYGLNGLLYGEYDNSGDLIREYIYLNDEPLAQVTAGSPEILTYLHVDHLGTPRFGTNSGGTQVWSWASDAFGNGAPSGSVTVNLRMPGQYYDAESGLFYNWNRYYNPATGRYISSDPIGLEGGLNTFNYAEQSPVMFVDPEGLNVIWMGARITAAACAKITACRNRIVSETARRIVKQIEQARPLIPYIPQICNMDDPDGTKSQPLWNTGSAVDDRSTIGQPPEDEDQRCRRVISACQNQCSEKFSQNPDSLPGSGSNYSSRIRICIRTCANINGCSY